MRVGNEFAKDQPGIESLAFVEAFDCPIIIKSVHDRPPHTLLTNPRGIVFREFIITYFSIKKFSLKILGQLD